MRSVEIASARTVQLPSAPEPGHYLLASVPGAQSGLLSEPPLGSALTPVSMNHSAAESDLTPLTAADLTRLLPGADITFAPFVPTRLHTMSEFWRWLILAALLFLVTESLLAWRTASESAEGGK